MIGVIPYVRAIVYCAAISGYIVTFSSPGCSVNKFSLAKVVRCRFLVAEI